MNQSRCDQNNNKAGSPLHIPVRTRGHAGGARTRPAARSFMSSPATPTHLPKVGARCTCVLRMQLGHQPGPGSSQGLFLPLVPRDAGMRREGGDPARRGSAAALLKDNAQDSGTAALRLRDAAAEAARGSCAARLGQGHPSTGEHRAPEPSPHTGFPPASEKLG